MINLVIGEDHNALVDGMKLFLSGQDDISFVGHATNGLELCELVRNKKPDVVITDLRMPIMDGVEATRNILKFAPETKIIAFSMFDQEEAVEEMIRAGAKGYLPKNVNLNDLLFATRQVYMGATYFHHSLHVTAKGEMVDDTKEHLTTRQSEILKLIGKGKTSSEIADTLYIGKSTVETHRKNMIKKLSLNGSGELLRYAMERRYEFE